MSYSILRVERVKGSGNTKGLQKHNQRENNNYNNKDIRHEDTHKNYDLINEKNIDYNKLIADKIDANYTGNRKIRADAIRHVEGIITSDEKFFNGLSEEETHQFFKDSLDFAKQEYGEENILYATVHFDEKVPHMHFGFVPLTDDGRLSAKEQLGNKKNMTELQDRFNQHVNTRGYSLERGTAKQVSEREHKDIDKFKKDTEFHKQELQTVKSDLKKLSEQLESNIRDLRAYSDFEYENEVEVTKGLFSGREELETGRKVVSAEEFERIQKTVTAARNIVDDYESLKDEDYYKKYNDLIDTSGKLLEQHKILKKEHQKIKEEHKELDSFVGKYQRFTEGLYKQLRKSFKGFEKAYSDFSTKLQQNEKTEAYGQFMDIIQSNVHEQDRKQQKDMDIER
jgi:hypothetical protein